MADFPLFELEVQIARLDHELLAGFNIGLGDDLMHQSKACYHGETAQLRHHRYGTSTGHALGVQRLVAHERAHIVAQQACDDALQAPRAQLDGVIVTSERAIRARAFRYWHGLFERSMTASDFALTWIAS